MLSFRRLSWWLSNNPVTNLIDKSVEEAVERCR
jgi:hypothetical protein